MIFIGRVVSPCAHNTFILNEMRSLLNYAPKDRLLPFIRSIECYFFFLYCIFDEKRFISSTNHSWMIIVFPSLFLCKKKKRKENPNDRIEWNSIIHLNLKRQKTLFTQTKCMHGGSQCQERSYNWRWKAERKRGKSDAAIVCDTCMNWKHNFRDVIVIIVNITLICT